MKKETTTNKLNFIFIIAIKCDSVTHVLPQFEAYVENNIVICSQYHL